jgi:3-dehydroquinate synthase
MRGIDWVYFPTTKMSQLDSCIGGKSSINLFGKKNLVGNIYPPREIHIDSGFDATLSKGALVSGYLEAVKISFAHSSDGFRKHLRIVQNYKDFDQIPHLELNSLVLNQKKYFVEEDEFDRGIRQKLNFGHTFGHAIESATDYAIPHGIAIGMGILIANRHPLTIQSDDVKELNAVVRNLLRKAELEFVEALSLLSLERFIESFLSDKKHAKGQYSVVIPGEFGLEKISRVWDDAGKSLIVDLVNEVRSEILNEI